MAASVGPIIVGTDFSDTAGVALQEARRLAGLMGAGLRVVHVLDVAPSASWDQTGAVRAWLERAGLTVEDMVIRVGKAWVELARYAAETAPLLVVVGSHGQSGFQPLEIGSTATRLTLQSRCPVVVVSPRVGVQDTVVSDVNRNVASRAEAVAVARVEPGEQQLTGETR